MDKAISQERISAIGWLIIALRVLIMVALFLVCVPFYYLWRLIRLPRFWPRIFLSGVGIAAGLKIEVKGRPRRNALLISNHVSWLDIPAISWASGSAFVGHSGLASMPLLKHLCAMNDTVFIERHIRSSVASQVEQVRFAIADTGALTLFPEGTTGDGIGLLPFKSSLLSAAEVLPDGVAVQPVFLEYADAPGISWAGDEHGLENFKRILARIRPVRLTLHFLAPLKGPELTDRKSIAAAAQKAIETAMNAPEGRIGL